MADPEVRADPDQLIRLGDQMLRCSQQIADAWRAAQPELLVPVGACGDSAQGPATRDSTETTVGEADVLLGRFVAVLEGDLDRLYRIAFSYEKADENAVNRFRNKFI
jgi:hypothetical protein